MGAVFTSAVSTWTPTTTADGAQLTGSGYHALRSATASGDFCRVLEFFIGGEASSSSVDSVAVRRHTTHASTPTNRVPASANPSSQASVFQGFITASTNPTVAALATIQHVLNFPFNAFGGVVRWVAAPGQEIWIYSNSANTDELSLSTIGTGTGVVSSHYAVEEM